MLKTNSYGKNKITIITKNTLPSVLPPWPVALDPTLNSVSLLKTAGAPIITYFKARSNDSDEALLVKATFGDGDLSMLQNEISEYLVKRLKRYQHSQDDIAKVRNITLSDEKISLLKNLFEPKPIENTVATEPPVQEKTPQIAPAVTISLENPNVMTIDGRSFRRKLIPMNGSCLFLCLIEGKVCPELITPSQWRQRLSQYLSDNLSQFAANISDDDIKSMRKNLENGFYNATTTGICPAGKERL